MALANLPLLILLPVAESVSMINDAFVVRIQQVNKVDEGVLYRNQALWPSAREILNRLSKALKPLCEVRIVLLGDKRSITQTLMMRACCRRGFEPRDH